MQDFAVFLSYIACLTNVFTSHVAFAGCYRGWHSWRDACYIPVYEKLNWLEAAKVCQRPGSDLFVTNSREEHEFMNKARVEWFGASNDLWIGCEVSNQTLTCLGENEEDEVWESWQGDMLIKPLRRCVFKGGAGNLRMGDCNIERLVVCEMLSGPGLTPGPLHCVSLGADGRVAPHSLHGREIKNLTVKGVGECGQACWAEPRCRTFNLCQGGPAKICQLNRATRLEANEDEFTEEANCTYFNL